MALACLLATLIHKQSSQIIRTLRNMPEVKDAFIVFGQYDLVVFLEADDYAELAAVTAEINKIEGITNTETLVAG
jgi:uncharacterized protein with GYD domain